MRKKIIAVLTAIAVVAVLVTGCSKEQKAPQGAAPGHDAQGTSPQPAAGGEVANPHGDMKSQAVSGSTVHKGKVVSTMNSGGYTYVEADEGGQKVWVAVMETKVKKGDEVEFPDAPPMENFYSKTLKRTFERIIFSPIIAVNGKTQAVPAVPKPTDGANPHAGMKTQEMH